VILGYKIRYPTIIALKDETKTAPADISFAILAKLLYVEDRIFSTTSIEVLTISHIKTRLMANNIAINSTFVKSKNRLNNNTAMPVTRWICIFL